MSAHLVCMLHAGRAGHVFQQHLWELGTDIERSWDTFMMEQWRYFHSHSSLDVCWLAR